MPHNINRLLLKGTSLLLFVAILGLANATTLIPLPLDIQVGNSSGAIKGTFIGSTSKKLKTGEVVTEALIRVDKVAGIEGNSLINSNNFKVLYPGGTWHDVSYRVHGAPSFKLGEEVVLLLADGPYGFQLINLSLSKYEVVQARGGVYLRNSAFPRHPKLGKIHMSDFNKVLQSHFGTKFVEASDKRHSYVHGRDSIPAAKVAKQKVLGNPSRGPASIPSGSPSGSPSRGIASVSVSGQEHESDAGSIGSGEDSSSMFWIMLIFIFLGCVSVLQSRSEKK